MKSDWRWSGNILTTFRLPDTVWTRRCDIPPQVRYSLTKPSFFDSLTDRSPFCLIFRPSDSDTAISIFEAMESRQILGFQRGRLHSGGRPGKKQAGASPSLEQNPRMLCPLAC